MSTQTGYSRKIEEEWVDRGFVKLLDDLHSALGVEQGRVGPVRLKGRPQAARHVVVEVVPTVGQVRVVVLRSGPIAVVCLSQ